MVRSYYQPGAGRAAGVEDLFAGIAPRYDLLNDLQSLGLHRWWKRRLVRLAGVPPGGRALDLCCGTGDVALGFARRGVQAVGLDFSGPMLAVARQRQERLARGGRGLAVEWVRGDALNLPFPEGHFDAVTISYGLRNLADVRRGLEEMLRVTRAGGRVLVLDFGKPEPRWWRAVYFFYLGRVVPLLGACFCRNAPAYAYILESLEHYPAQAGVTALLRELGCREVELQNILGGAMSIHCAVKPAG
ncbi:MAG: class I SAM-dependent methyltransferase [Verrucomicrobiae bacterium]|nr:class I SAM-dependent methyltransferase [Verrucomicrobiae bacterium]